MKKQEIKLVLFAVTISVLLISMGNMPIATAGTVVPQATMTVNLFCDLKVSASNVALGGQNPNAVVPFDFSLQNVGNGLSTATLTGAQWETDPGNLPLIAVGNTSFEVIANGIGVNAFTGAAQALGTFDAGEAAETVDLDVTITLIIVDYTGDATLDMLVTETGCVAAPAVAPGGEGGTGGPPGPGGGGGFG